MRVLVVEDEPALAAAVDGLLRDQGHAVDVAPDCRRARLFAATHDYDLAVVDRMLPDGEGLGLCAEWRAADRTMPVLVLTALDGASAVVAGLEAGADDYLTKPFSSDELVARVRALLRRRPTAVRSVVRVGSVQIDRAARSIEQHGVVVPVTTKEFAVLEVLALADGRVVDRFEILERCWDMATEPGSNVVDVLVRRLRRKLGDGVVQTVRGAGYRIGTP